MTRYLDGSLAIFENSDISSLNLGRLDGSIIQPGDRRQEVNITFSFQLNTRRVVALSHLTMIM